jgi:hypothetical protein
MDGVNTVNTVDAVTYYRAPEVLEGLCQPQRTVTLEQLTQITRRMQMPQQEMPPMRMGGDGVIRVPFEIVREPVPVVPSSALRKVRAPGGRVLRKMRFRKKRAKWLARYEAIGRRMGRRIDDMAWMMVLYRSVIVPRAY